MWERATISATRSIRAAVSGARMAWSRSIRIRKEGAVADFERLTISSMPAPLQVHDEVSWIYTAGGVVWQSRCAEDLPAVVGPTANNLGAADNGPCLAEQCACGWEKR